MFESEFKLLRNITEISNANSETFQLLPKLTVHYRPLGKEIGMHYPFIAV